MVPNLSPLTPISYNLAHMFAKLIGISCFKVTRKQLIIVFDTIFSALNPFISQAATPEAPYLAAHSCLALTASMPSSYFSVSTNSCLYFLIFFFSIKKKKKHVRKICLQALFTLPPLFTYLYYGSIVKLCLLTKTCSPPNDFLISYPDPG